MQHVFSPARLEAFSDGVLAVIITIMVLELRVPTVPGPAGIRVVLPTLLVYLLSFTFISVYWVNHHQLINRLAHCNNRILWANLVWMFTLSLIPFFTRYTIEMHLDSFSVAVYAACMLCAGTTFILLRYAVDCQLQIDGIRTQVDRLTALKHWGSLGLYAISIVIACYAPRAALAVTGIVRCV